MPTKNQSVSEEYLIGIKEGRQLLNIFKADNGCNPSRLEVQAFIDENQTVMDTFSPGPVKDLYKGELDFWKGQLNRA